MRLNSAGLTGVSVAETPTIIIGLPGSSMRSQAVSMLDMRWWPGPFMRHSVGIGRDGDPWAES
jgi:hypothetical protein